MRRGLEKWERYGKATGTVMLRERFDGRYEGRYGNESVEAPGFSSRALSVAQSAAKNGPKMSSINRRISTGESQSASHLS